jgi:hypothetical protein
MLRHTNYKNSLSKCGYCIYSNIAKSIYEGGPKNNWNLNVARELEVVARCAARCRE